MQSGVITSENFSQIMRQLSQKRRHGVLEINTGEVVLQVVFHSGRIIEIIDSSCSPAVEVAERLHAAGYLSNLEGLGELEGVEYKDLFQQLASLSKSISLELFKLVIKHRILDRLYSLDFGTGAYYTFKTRVHDCDRELLPSLSTGQLLLDLVAIDADRERFESTFPVDRYLVVVEDLEPAHSEEEKLLITAIGSGILVEALRKRTVLSAFHFQETLLALHERGEIQVVEQIGTAHKESQRTPSAEELPDLSMVDDMMAALDDSIDAAFAEEGIAIKDTQDNGTLNLDEVVNADADGEIEEYSDEVISEEDDLIDEAEEAELLYQSNFRIRMNLFNMKLLRLSMVPHIVIVLFILFSVLVPLFTWRRMLSLFG